MLSKTFLTEQILRFQDPKYLNSEIEHLIGLTIFKDYYPEDEEFIKGGTAIEKITTENSYSFFRFKVNNFLDTFKEDEFQYLEKNNHLGIGYLELNNSLKFFIYEWELKQDYSFKLKTINFIPEASFIAYVVNSTNEDLKDFLKNDFKESVISTDEDLTVFSMENENLKLKQIIHDLKEEIKLKDRLISDYEEELSEGLSIINTDFKPKTVFDLSEEETTDENLLNIVREVYSKGKSDK